MLEKENEYKRLEMKNNFYRHFWLENKTPEDDNETEERGAETMLLEVGKYVKEIENLEAEIAECNKKIR